MAADEATLTIEAAQWSDTAAQLLAEAHHGTGLADVQAQVSGGTARLFLLAEEPGAQPIGAFVLRIDQTSAGPQGVIVSAAGHRQGIDLIDTVLPAIEGMFSGVHSIRYHTRKPALARRLAARGYAPSEIVSVKQL